MRPIRLMLGVVLALGAQRLAAAHDFWIEPTAWRPEPGAVLGAHLRIGHPGAPEPYARNPEHVASFALVGDAGAVNLAGLPGADPAGRARIERAGRYVVVYRSHPSAIELEAAKFEGYLREKGLDRVIVERRARGETDAPGRESYARCAKALVRTPGAAAGPSDRVVGLPLELVLEGDLEAPGPEPAPLRVRLYFEGRPLEGARVDLQPLAPPEPAGDAAAAPAAAQTAFTGPDGVASLPPLPARDARSAWLLTAVHMQRAPAGAPQEWRSFWASLTFEAPARAAR